MASASWALEIWYTFFQVISGTFWLVKRTCHEMIYGHTPSYHVFAYVVSCIVLLFRLCYTTAVQDVELLIRVGYSRRL
jgi:hypothetical protein